MTWKNFENHMLNEAVSKNRLKKLKVMFDLISRELKKPIDTLKRKDIEDFLNKLNRNQIKKQDGKDFSGSTKADIKKFFKQYFKWLRGNNEIYPPEVAWIKTRIAKDEKPEEKPVISIKEAVKLAHTFKKIENGILTLLLFDSGFRIQEMLSATKKDLTWEEFDDENKCFWIKCNESKTYTRKIPVPLFTEELKAFCNSAYFRTLEENDILFPVSYNWYRTALKKNSKALLKKEITPHALRHSSATYYSREYDGNMNLIAQRYGWSLSSDELKTYIRKSGAYQKLGARKSYSNKTNEEIKELKRKLNMIAEAINQSQTHQKTKDGKFIVKPIVFKKEMFE